MSSVERTIRLEDFPPEFEVALIKAVTTLGATLGLEVLRVLHREIVTRSPVGHPAVDLHPGKFRASNTPSVGAPVFAQLPDLPSYFIPGAEAIDALFGRIEPDMPLYEANAAASDGRNTSYASILEGGRRPDKNGRMIGSLQAEDGVYEPSVEATAAQSAIIAAAAIRRTEQLI